MLLQLVSAVAPLLPADSLHRLQSRGEVASDPLTGTSVLITNTRGLAEEVLLSSWGAIIIICFLNVFVGVCSKGKRAN